MWVQHYTINDVINLRSLNHAFLIRRGMFEGFVMYRNVPQKVIRLKSRDTVNFIDGFFNNQRSLTDMTRLRCIEDACVYAIHLEELRAIFLETSYQESLCDLSKESRRIFGYLDTNPLFAGLSIQDKCNLSACSEIMEHNQGDIVLYPKQPCVVCQGCVRYKNTNYVMGQMIWNFASQDERRNSNDEDSTPRRSLETDVGGVVQNLRTASSDSMITPKRLLLVTSNEPDTYTVLTHAIVIKISLEAIYILLKPFSKNSKEYSQTSRTFARTLSSNLLADIKQTVWPNFQYIVKDITIPLIGSELDALNFLQRKHDDADETNSSPNSSSEFGSDKRPSSSSVSERIMFLHQQTLVKTAHAELILALCKNNGKRYILKHMDKQQGIKEYYISRFLINSFCSRSEAILLFDDSCFIVTRFYPWKLTDMIQNLRFETGTDKPPSPSTKKLSRKLVKCCCPLSARPLSPPLLPTNPSFEPVLDREQVIKILIASLIIAFEYLHENGILFRDIKLENVMIDERGYPQIIDYGSAKRLKNHMRTFSFHGSPNYMAPELFTGRGYDFACDVWGLGVLAYVCLTGLSSPWRNATQISEIMTQILNFIPQTDLVWEGDLLPPISHEARSFVKSMMNPNPALRPRMRDVRNDRWFADLDWVSVENKEYILPKPPLIECD